MIRASTNLFNRRIEERAKLGAQVAYSRGGELQRSELLNLSQGGARITAAIDLQLGEELVLRFESSKGRVRHAAVTVMWVEPLSCGVRSVVGLQFLPANNRSKFHSLVA